MTNRFVYHFVSIITPIFFLFFVFVNDGEAQTQAGETSAQQKPVKKVDAPKPLEFYTRKKMDLIKELDDVMREMIWLIRTQRPTANKTLFGKVYRALQHGKGGKLTEKSKHTCDQYSVETVSQYQYRIFEHCQKHRNPDLLAKIDWSQGRVQFQFQGQNYADTLGLAASLTAPTIDCQVNFEDEAKLTAFQCTGFRITRLDHVIRFESVVYKKGKDPMMYLKGEVLKNLLPYSDYQITVPLTGKVKIVEKKKVPDIDEMTPEQKEKEKLKAKQDAPRIPIAQPLPPPPIDPRKPVPAPRDTESTDPNQPPRDTEIDPNDPNSGLLKNSPPEIIEIQEPPPRTR